MAPPLTGLRVLDLTQGVAGPYCTKLFSDYGAEVLKIERPGLGDPARRLGPFPHDEPHPERSGMYLELNTGKQSVTLNLKTETGREILRRLAADADLVVESFRPGTVERLGLGFEELQRVRPQAPLVSISNFGQFGPYRDFEADDMLLYAMGGVLSVTRSAGREPVKIGLYAPLFLAGAVAAAFSFGAFMAGRRTGRGQHVDISLHEVLASSMDRGGPSLAAWEYNRAIPQTGQARAGAMPSGVYPTADGYIHINAQVAWWPRLCRMLGRLDLVDDEEWRSHLTDVAYGPELDAIFYPWLLARSKQQVMEEAQAAGIPVGAINSSEDVFRDPHLRAREFFQTVDHPATGPLEYPGLPFRMLGTPGELRRAPLLGEHTREVLCGRLGYSPEDVARLGQHGIV